LKHPAGDPSLGVQISAFRGRPIEFPTWFVIFLPGALIIIAGYAYGTYLAVTTYQQHGPALAVERSQSWFFWATLLLIVFTAFLVYRILISLQFIQLFENGIKIRDSYLRSRIFRWEEISGISSSATTATFLGRPFRTTPKCWIFPAAGKPISLSSEYQDLPEVIRLIKSKIYPLVWPQMKSRFRTGRPIQFGRIIINHKQVKLSNQSIPWQSILRIYTQGGYLVVELRDNSKEKFPVIDMPNIELLLKAVEWGIQ
jgi:hypothetical protein